MADNFAGTYYPQLREALDPRFAAFSDAELEDAFEDAFGEGVTPAEYEEFFGGLGKALGKVGSFVKQVGPAALQGAAGGSALGPFGAIGGAIAGATGAALKGQRGAAGTIGNVLSGAVNTAGQLTGRGGLAQAAAGLVGRRGGGPGGAAAGLLGLLRRPEMAAALQSLIRGRNTAVPVGPGATPVPANAFAGLLGALAREAEAEAFDGDAAESVPGYLLGPQGQVVADPGDPDQRAARLLHLLAAHDAALDDAYDEGYDEGNDDSEAYEESLEEYLIPEAYDDADAVLVGGR